MQPLPITQPLWLRITHWLTAIAVLLLVTSGWQIYNASPIFGSQTFPHAISLGGWLGGALLWHFAAMWLLVGSFIVYLVMSIATGRFRHRLLPPNVKSVLQDAGAALRGRLSHDDLGQYNAVQKAAYLVVIIDILLVILSGLVLWKSVQFPLLRTLMGGYEGARVVHFVCMSLLVAFFAVHVAMVVIVPRSLAAMLRGR